MHSSPLGPPDFSPDRAREKNYIALGRRTQSLEWACAASRLKPMDQEDHPSREDYADDLDGGCTGKDTASLQRPVLDGDDLIAAHILCKIAGWL